LRQFKLNVVEMKFRCSLHGKKSLLIGQTVGHVMCHNSGVWRQVHCMRAGFVVLDCSLLPLIGAIIWLVGLW